MKPLILAGVLVPAISFALAPSSAFATHNNGWATECEQGGSGKACKDPPNAGSTETEQPKGQVGKTGNNSPKECTGPKGQCDKL